MTFCTLPFSSGDVVRILKKLDNASFFCNLFGDIPYFDQVKKMHMLGNLNLELCSIILRKYEFQNH
uniref:Uncharacterized protein n=1 Tax=Arundo donax TaxID=35708 RepID=A0A0A9BS11_ARUDO